MVDKVRMVARGVEAGLVAGGVVVAVFFFADLIQLRPLQTPIILQRTFIGPGGTPLAFPVVAQISATAALVVRLACYTALHFAAFAGLGAGAALLVDRGLLPAGVIAGALYGAVTATAALYLALAVAGVGLVAELPGAVAVVGANLVAGGIMGGYLRVAEGMDADDEGGELRELAGTV